MQERIGGGDGGDGANRVVVILAGAAQSPTRRRRESRARHRVAFAPRDVIRRLRRSLRRGTHSERRFAKVRRR